MYSIRSILKLSQSNGLPIASIKYSVCKSNTNSITHKNKTVINRVGLTECEHNYDSHFCDNYDIDTDLLS